MDIKLGAGIVPILPLRINFLLYTKDYLNQLLKTPKDHKYNLNEEITMIDLGCGPAAIFTVLGRERQTGNVGNLYTFGIHTV